MRKSVLVGLTILLCGSVNMAGGEPIAIDGYAAAVNERIITTGEIKSTIRPILARIRSQVDSKRLNSVIQRLSREALQKLIEQALIIEEFNQKDFNFPQAALDQEEQRIIQGEFNDNPLLFRKWLKSNHKSIEDWRAETKDKLIVRMMLQHEVYNRVNISPGEIRQAYRERKETFRIPAQLKFSLISVGTGTNETEREIKHKEIESIHDKLSNGADFSKLARDLSEGPRTQEGGAFPWTNPDQLQPAFSEALEQLTTGKISDIITTDNSFYIVKVDARRKASFKPLSEVQDTLKESLKKKKISELREKWIDQLREKHYVEIFSDQLEN